MHLFDQLNADGQNLARVPILAKLIALLPNDRLQRCKTKAAIYWEVYTWVGQPGATGLLDTGLESAGARHLGYKDKSSVDEKRSASLRKRQMRLARDILALVAFEMMCGKEGVGEHPVYEVDETFIESFRVRVIEKLKTRKADLYHGDFDSLPSADLDCIQEMNAQGLSYILGTFFNKETIYFERTVRNFFAAFWAARWADESDQLLMMNWIPSPNQISPDQTNPDQTSPDQNNVPETAYLEFWEIFEGLGEIEEPDPANNAFDRPKWEAMIAVLKGESQGPPVVVDAEEQVEMDRLKNAWVEHVQNEWESQWLKVNLSDDDQNPHWVSTGSLEFLEYKRAHPDNWYHLVEKARADKPPT